MSNRLETRKIYVQKRTDESSFSTFKKRMIALVIFCGIIFLLQIVFPEFYKTRSWFGLRIKEQYLLLWIDVLWFLFDYQRKILKLDKNAKFEDVQEVLIEVGHRLLSFFIVIETPMVLAGLCFYYERLQDFNWAIYIYLACYASRFLLYIGLLWYNLYRLRLQYHSNAKKPQTLHI